MASPSEYAAVRRVLEQYFEASYTANVPLLKTLFHPDALMSGYYDGELGIGTPEPYYEDLMAATSSKDAGEQYEAEIAFIHIAGAIASAGIVEDNLLGLNYVNHYHLLKIEGEWRIISKIYAIVD